MKIKQYGWFLKLVMPKGFTAITIYPFGIFTKNKVISATTKQEEYTHWLQQKEMLGIFFYVWYFFEWVIKAITPPVGAYVSLGFEREAKANLWNKKYNTTRKHFAWFKYIKKQV